MIAVVKEMRLYPTPLAGETRRAFQRLTTYRRGDGGRYALFAREPE